MRERLKAAFKYKRDHPEPLTIICSLLLAFASMFTVTFNSNTTPFLSLLSTGLVVSGFCVIRYSSAYDSKFVWCTNIPHVSMIQFEG